MHSVPLQPVEENTPCLWTRLRHFINCCNPTCKPVLAANFPSKQELLELASDLEKKLMNDDKITDDIVFCHNDALLNNVIIQEKNVINFIDLEYGAANYAAFDIANHFCEFVGCDGVLDYATWLPKKDWQLQWLKKYLEVREERDVIQEEVEKLQSNVEHFMLAAHLLWAVWAVIQAENSSIDFDFEDYALQRLQEFKRWKLYLKVD